MNLKSNVVRQYDNDKMQLLVMDDHPYEKHHLRLNCALWLFKVRGHLFKTEERAMNGLDTCLLGFTSQMMVLSYTRQHE